MIPNLDHNSKSENKKSENVYITGDNLEVLKHLRKSYTNTIACCYIDPPYNTGGDGFVYNDSYTFTARELEQILDIEEDEAKRILNMTSTNSSSHSAWLTFMYPRLYLARELLKDDGIIFISIDDNQQAQLRIICDDIFGEENFVSQIIIQSNKRGQTYKDIAKTHEYLFVYSKSEKAIINKLENPNHEFRHYDNIGGFTERELRNRNPKFGRFNRPNLYYPIYVNPNKVDKNGYNPVSITKDEDFCIEVLPKNSKGEDSCWRWGRETFKRANDKKNTLNSHVVGKLKTTGEYGVYEKYREDKVTAKTIWFSDELYVENGTVWDETDVITEKGSVELGELGLSGVFDYPKPVSLIKKSIQIAMNSENDDQQIILDFFSGSATTAHALMEQNAKDKSDHKYILVQLDEPVKQNSVAEKQGYKTIDEIGRERIVRAAEKVKKDTNEEIDYGFKHFYAKVLNENIIDQIKEFDPNLLASEFEVEFDKETILTTWMNQDGHGLTPSIEEVNLGGYTGYYMQDYLYLLDKGMSQQHIDILLSKIVEEKYFNPTNVVVYGYNFTDFNILTQLETNLKQLRNEEKSIEVSLIKRY